MEGQFHFTGKYAKLARAISLLVRQERLDYAGLRATWSMVRRAVELGPKKRARHLPQVVSEAQLKKFFEVIVEENNLQHEIMFKLLFYTAVRVAELCSIRMEHVDLDASRLYIESGKGDKDRYILFPDQFRLVLRVYMANCQDNRYLFESRHKTKYTTRRIQQIVQEYAAIAELPIHMHPHLLRHQMLTYLTSEGLPDAQIQLISGHSSKKSLEVYQHLSLNSVKENYQEAVRKLGI